ncbi:MAG: exodeoxyribonuclease VII small subunit [Bacteroidales bacterium]|jgi:exodeoxyribonuclease VII small subunit|nr:exodeoxyribonuclease VII small subunit [Bacteroidales bacterium]
MTDTEQLSELSYKDAITEIEQILEKIEREELDVDELSEQVKRVLQLSRLCREKLHRTETEVEAILQEMQQ